MTPLSVRRAYTGTTVGPPRIGWLALSVPAPGPAGRVRIGLAISSLTVGSVPAVAFAACASVLPARGSALTGAPCGTGSVPASADAGACARSDTTASVAAAAIATQDSSRRRRVIMPSS